MAGHFTSSRQAFFFLQRRVFFRIIFLKVSFFLRNMKPVEVLVEVLGRYVASTGKSISEATLLGKKRSEAWGGVKAGCLVMLFCLFG